MSMDFGRKRVSYGVIGEGNYVAGKVRAATIAAVNVSGGGVVESSVEVVAGALAVELARAVGQVKLLNNSEHDVVCGRTLVCWCALIKNIPLQPFGEHTCRAPTRQDRCAFL